MVKQKHNYWNDETRISELKKVIEEIGHFPTHEDLQKIGRWDLQGNIAKNGGLYKYAQLLGHIQKQRPKYYFASRGIESSVKEMVGYFGRFPHKKEMAGTEWGTLYVYLLKTGTLNHYRDIYSYKPIRKPNGYWSDKTIISELNHVIYRINRFPTKKDLYSIGRGDLANQITLHGGANRFRKLMNHSIKKEKNGFWNDEVIIENLKRVIDKKGYFPTRRDLLHMSESRLSNAINEHGGLAKFQRMLGVSYDYFKSYKSAMYSYVVYRGKNTENMIYEILCNYCESNRLPNPTKNTKLTNREIIEFICATHKTIGIDVTNCDSKSSVYRKWTKKEYHKYVDELWIIVVSDSFDKKDYEIWNNESPHNVYVMSIEDFCNELQYDIDESTKHTIDKYKKCTFHTRNKYEKRK